MLPSPGVAFELNIVQKSRILAFSFSDVRVNEQDGFQVALK